MRILVAGSTGVLGGPVAVLLSEAGHTVVGLGRRQVDTPRGGGYIQADVRSSGAVREAVRRVEPDTIISLIGDLPEQLGAGRLDGAYERNDETRLLGTRNLMRAAALHNVRRVIVASMAFLYEPGSKKPRSEMDPLVINGPPPVAAMAQCTLDVERLATGTAGVEGTVLRFGFLYGPGTWWASDGSLTQMVRRRRYPIIGDGTGVYSWVHVRDAAAAVVAAIETRSPGTFNVVDDDPVEMRTWLPSVAEILGAAPPRRVPARVARLVAGAAPVYYATKMASASNEQARKVLGWKPEYGSWVVGFSHARG